MSEPTDTTAEQVVYQHLNEAAMVLNHAMTDPAFIRGVVQASQILTTCLKQQQKIISIGNGGSHCDAMHFAEELSGRYRGNRPPLAALSVSDPAYLSCVSNDYGYENVFSRFIEAVGKPNDVLFAISTSGQSANVLRAVDAAQQKQMAVIGLLGNGGGQLKNRCDVEILVPHHGYADRVQEMHIKIIHTLIDLIERDLGYATSKKING